MACQGARSIQGISVPSQSCYKPKTALKKLNLKNKCYLKCKKDSGAALNIIYAFVTSPPNVFSPNQSIFYTLQITETKSIITSLQWQSIYSRWHVRLTRKKQV